MQHFPHAREGTHFFDLALGETAI